LFGLRSLLAATGVHLFVVGVLDTALYVLLREPSELEKAMEPELESVRYPIAHWALTVGLVLLAFGVVLVAAGWFTSPRWHPDTPHRATRDLERLGLATIGVAVALGIVMPLLAKPSGRILALVPGVIGVAWVLAVWLTRKQPIDSFRR